MRATLVLGSILLLTACSGDPRSYGITGPGAPRALAPSPQASADTAPTPGVPTLGYYGPTRGPSAGDSGFWGYNN
jgi:hypothetical protein